MIIIKHSKINEGFVKPLKDKIWVKQDGSVIDIETINTIMDAVIQDLGANYPSVEAVLKHKDIVLTDNPYVQSMATDGISIFVNPAFVEYLLNLDENEGALFVEYVFIHEALHVLFDHCFKHATQSDKFSDAEKVNYAQDYEINYIIENFLREGLNTAPFKGKTEKIGGLYNESYGKKGLTWEEIYEILPNIQRSKSLAKTSDKFKDGFKEGYDEVIAELRKNNKID